ncbi:hypothetical protein [Desulfoferrobacter suflitae]|uniref:hypothetical protein n=1 Tax=Desulfoferrobacter suflitae TaxID=2865782 RepID=UPI002164D570|nr:hypothetical protein [Desulfoferrobacter suflitae]MCK8600089.1 hypothetical protein [Desulfoferrobacter suflitae]
MKSSVLNGHSPHSSGARQALQTLCESRWMATHAISAGKATVMGTFMAHAMRRRIRTVERSSSGVYAMTILSLLVLF